MADIDVKSSGLQWAPIPLSRTRRRIVWNPVIGVKAKTYRRNAAVASPRLLEYSETGRVWQDSSPLPGLEYSYKWDLNTVPMPIELFLVPASL